MRTGKMIHSATLVNDPFGDPGVYVDFRYRREAFLFDLGDIHLLPPRKLLKIDYIFVSHTHMDHFIGFDHLLRISLGRDRRIHLYGPPNFLRNVEDKLHSYTWNLVANYTNNFELLVTEVHPEQTISRRYRCRNAFLPEGEERAACDGTLVQGDFFSVRSALLDHGTPCLAFRFEEKTRINIKKNVLREMGLPTGAWLQELKAHLVKGEPDDLPVRIWWRGGDGRREEKTIPLGVLRRRGGEDHAGADRILRNRCPLQRRKCPPDRRDRGRCGARVHRGPLSRCGRRHRGAEMPSHGETGGPPG